MATIEQMKALLGTQKAEIGRHALYCSMRNNIVMKRVKGRVSRKKMASSVNFDWIGLLRLTVFVWHRTQWRMAYVSLGCKSLLSYYNAEIRDGCNLLLILLPKMWCAPITIDVMLSSDIREVKQRTVNSQLNFTNNEYGGSHSWKSSVDTQSNLAWLVIIITVLES